MELQNFQLGVQPSFDPSPHKGALVGQRELYNHYGEIVALEQYIAPIKGKQVCIKLKV
jgi:hypothetical protein